mmetsp:Transcript_85981/g.184316  ORF Transcript_85981/g.184316 Transcript_85981/m.184316 type:complete len:225 (+) Transcript_85981:374-1048(+)
MRLAVSHLDPFASQDLSVEAHLALQDPDIVIALGAPGALCYVRLVLGLVGCRPEPKLRAHAGHAAILFRRQLLLPDEVRPVTMLGEPLHGEGLRRHPLVHLLVRLSIDPLEDTEVIKAKAELRRPHVAIHAHPSCLTTSRQLCHNPPCSADHRCHRGPCFAVQAPLQVIGARVSGLPPDLYSTQRVRRAKVNRQPLVVLVLGRPSCVGVAVHGILREALEVLLR